MKNTPRSLTNVTPNYTYQYAVGKKKKNSAIYRSCEISMWKIGPTIFKRQTRRSEEKLYRS